jgi:peptidoglycan/xylan/chitin deacetylase (PgdA/CDA1 family)
MKKSQIKRAFAKASAPVMRGRERTVVLCYHSVHPDRKCSDARPDTFRAHLEYFDRECRVVDPHSFLCGELTSASDDSRPRVVLTFDDGYADNATFVRRMLSEFGFKAAFFVTTGLVDRQSDVVARMRRLMRLAESDVDFMMGWQDVAALANDGHLIGSHGVTHRNLANLDAGEQERELVESRSTAELRLTLPVLDFAFPFGKPRVHQDEPLQSLSRQAGYRSAFSVEFSRVRQDSPFDIPRFTMNRDSIGDLELKIDGGFDVVGSWQRHAPRWLLRRISPWDFTFE